MNQLAHELLLQIISYLDHQDLHAFIESNGTLYYQSQQDIFWKDLCKLKGISYCHPDITWRALYESGKINSMCTHLRLRHIQEKKKEFWTLLDQFGINGSLMFCLHPSCHHFGNEHEFEAHPHPIALTLSPLHILEIRCRPCSKIISLDKEVCDNHGLKSEQYMLRGLLNVFMSLSDSDPDLSQKMIRGRRQIERNLYRFQARFSQDHIIEKGWYRSWLEFISGKTNTLPGPLKNNSLFIDDSLNPDISLNQDFEIVSDFQKKYIERFYGLSGLIVPLSDLQYDAKYCKLVHTIKLRHQMQQIRYTSSLVLTEL